LERCHEHGTVLPATPLAPVLGFQPLPGRFFLALTLMVLAYLALIELGKYLFYHAPTPPPARHRDPHRHARRRAARFTAWAHQPPRPPGRSGRTATVHSGGTA
jgi:Mg2+-importing ATPase